IQAPTRGHADQPVNGPVEPALIPQRDGHTIEGHAHILAHILKLAMLLALEPRQHGITRKIVRPSLEGFRHVYPQLEGMLHDGRAWIRRKNIRPELRAWKFAADVHHEADRLPAIALFLARVAKDHVEG